MLSPWSGAVVVRPLDAVVSYFYSFSLKDRVYFGLSTPLVGGLVIQQELREDRGYSPGPRGWGRYGAAALGDRLGSLETRPGKRGRVTVPLAVGLVSRALGGSPGSDARAWSDNLLSSCPGEELFHGLLPRSDGLDALQPDSVSLVDSAVTTPPSRQVHAPIFSQRAHDFHRPSPAEDHRNHAVHTTIRMFSD